MSGDDGSIVINQPIRDDEFNPDTEFIPVSAENEDLYNILRHETRHPPRRRIKFPFEGFPVRLEIYEKVKTKPPEFVTFNV